MIPDIIPNEHFRTMNDDQKVDLFTLSSGSGVVVQITNYGGRIVSLFTPDRSGTPGNIVLGFRSLDQYLNASERFYGAVVGRYANRIAKGQFVLDGETFALATNDGPNHLHGGTQGFDRVVWQVEAHDEDSLTLRYRAAHMEEGYPGNVDIRLSYRLLDDALTITYVATTDRPTILNLSHHSYFNLAGAGSGPIVNHELTLNSDSFTAIDDTLIPTGEIRAVDDTPMDFRIRRRIGDGISDSYDQIAFGKGYDHNWVLLKTTGEMAVAAKVFDPSSGRQLEVRTDEPGIQFYSGNFFDGTDIGSSGEAHRFREAFALETQHFPDSPNHPHFPSTILRPGEEYRSHCSYTFTVVDK